jgi:hypothetical protein
MNLKNYTSSIPAQTTISYIEAYLMDVGATGIMKKIKDGHVVALVFEIEDENRQHRLVKLPANVEAVHEYLWHDYVTTRTKPQKTKEDFLEQAGRTAWKILQDWVQVQMSMIKLNQMTVLQVFMPMLFDGRQTYYEYLQDNKFKALPAPKHEELNHGQAHD